MDRSWLIEQLQSRPGMFSLDGSFRMYGAFLRGYQCGADAVWLQDFQAWLVRQLGTGQNLGWEALMLRSVFPDDPTKWRYPAQLSEEDDVALCRALFSWLRRFDTEFPEPKPPTRCE
ncbi:hypothetical protein GCM10009743_25800 [Kribbella swartbergensis]